MAIQSRKRRKDAGSKRKPHGDYQVATRLNPGNEAEAKAIETLEEWRKQIDPETGERFALRKLITNLILNFSGNEIPSSTKLVSEEISGSVREEVKQGIDEIMQQLEELREEMASRLEELEIRSTSEAPKKPGKTSKPPMDKKYLLNLKKALKGEEDEE